VLEFGDGAGAGRLPFHPDLQVCLAGILDLPGMSTLFLLRHLVEIVDQVLIDLQLGLSAGGHADRDLWRSFGIRQVLR